MLRASGGWMQRAIDAGMLEGSGVVLPASAFQHIHDILNFVRCRLVCRGQDPGWISTGSVNHGREDAMGTPGHAIESFHRERTRAIPILLLIVGISAGMVMALAVPAPAVEGYWWGSPVNPGFDRNTVIQAMGTVLQVDIAARGGPGTLSLQTVSESITVILGPSWFLSEQHVDIQNGDPLVVEGAKMMDRRGHLHLVAASVTNRRTGSVLRLRDEEGASTLDQRPSLPEALTGGDRSAYSLWRDKIALPGLVQRGTGFTTASQLENGGHHFQNRIFRRRRSSSRTDRNAFNRVSSVP